MKRNYKIEKADGNPEDMLTIVIKTRRKHYQAVRPLLCKLFGHCLAVYQQYSTTNLTATI